MDVALPVNCFISHSYADAAVRDRLLGALPPELQPRVFPPKTVSPDEFVSNSLIQAILDSEGLIYLRGGASDGLRSSATTR
jgi:hypothetical protein